VSSCVNGRSRDHAASKIERAEALDRSIVDDMPDTVGGTVWLTGLPAAGKSTIAKALHGLLLERGVESYLLDGDDLREGLNADLGFSERDRSENVRRLGEVAILLARLGYLAIVSAPPVERLFASDTLRWPLHLWESTSQLHSKCARHVIQEVTTRKPDEAGWCRSREYQTLMNHRSRRTSR
jgi:hypothetical protein